MRKIVIGRSKDCDIVIKDTTDVVSRHQAVITVDFWGRMMLYDTSINGTYVNGVRMPKPDGMAVTRKDKVNFGHVWDFDLTTVADPYRTTKLWCIAGFVAVLLLAFLLCLIPWGGKEEPAVAGSDSKVVDTRRPSAPDTTSAATPAPQQQEARPARKPSGKKKSSTKSSNAEQAETAPEKVTPQPANDNPADKAPLIF